MALHYGLGHQIVHTTRALGSVLGCSPRARSRPDRTRLRPRRSSPRPSIQQHRQCPADTVQNTCSSCGRMLRGAAACRRNPSRPSPLIVSGSTSLRKPRAYAGHHPAHRDMLQSGGMQPLQALSAVMRTVQSPWSRSERLVGADGPVNIIRSHEPTTGRGPTYRGLEL